MSDSSEVNDDDPPPTAASRATGKPVRRQAPSSAYTAWLEQHAGFVLIAGGAALIALAAVLADRPAVAPIFALFGSAMLILGCFYSRIEGRMEATKDGVRAVIREIERLTDEQDLPPEAVPDAIDAALEAYWRSAARRSDTFQMVQDAARLGVESARITHERILNAFAQWLMANGWRVTHQVSRRGAQPDLLAERAEETLVVEVKAPASGSRSRVMGVRQVQSYVQALREEFPSARGALVVSSTDKFSYLTARAARELDVDVYSVDDGGEVRRVLSARDADDG